MWILKLFLTQGDKATSLVAFDVSDFLPVPDDDVERNLMD